jgi:hypothetical protein
LRGSAVDWDDLCTPLRLVESRSLVLVQPGQQQLQLAPLTHPFPQRSLVSFSFPSSPSSPSSQQSWSPFPRPLPLYLLNSPSFDGSNAIHFRRHPRRDQLGSQQGRLRQRFHLSELPQAQGSPPASSRLRGPVFRRRSECRCRSAWVVWREREPLDGGGVGWRGLGPSSSSPDGPGVPGVERSEAWEQSLLPLQPTRKRPPARRQPPGDAQQSQGVSARCGALHYGVQAGLEVAGERFVCGERVVREGHERRRKGAFFSLLFPSPSFPAHAL